MLKKLKKLYFKIYHLFKLISIFIFFFIFSISVKADTCNNLYIPNPTTIKTSTSGSNTYIRPTLDGNNYYQLRVSSVCNSSSYICITSGQTYTAYALDNNNNLINLMQQNINSINVIGNDYSSNTYTEVYSSTKTITSNTNTFAVIIPTANLTQSQIDYYANLNWYIVEGTEPCYPTINPPTPPEPQPNGVYTNFIALYTNKLSYLAEGFTSNPYLIAMIGIIISWVVLEITLKLLNLKGGNKK